MTTTTVQTGNAPASSGTGPNDAALAAKIDKANEPTAGNPTPPPAKPERPAEVPEKFWDAEKGEVKLAELAKSYSELEKKQSSAKDPKAPPSTEPGDTAASDAKTLVEQAGLDFDAMSSEFDETGDLSAETRAALAKAGFSQAQVDTYVAGIKAQGAALTSAAYDAAGGEEQFQAVIGWAKESASAADIAAYDDLIASGDPAKIALAVKGLVSKYEAAEGKLASRTISGNANGADVGDAYESVEQMKADMKNPLYKTDPAFRKKVEGKLARSKVL